MAGFDLIGQTFGRLTVVARVRGTPSGQLWRCSCSCGGYAERLTTQLRRPGLKGCSACNSQVRSDASTLLKHGGAKGGKSKLYMVWKGMHSRCRDPGNTSYTYYGGRGVGICQEWTEFPAFQEWALANGYAPGLSIDRLNPRRDYSPENCEWVTRSENSRRRNANRLQEASI